MSTPLLDRPSALPQPCVPALVDLVAALADNKHALGLRYGEWCSGGPTIEACVAATGLAQDELGHARVLYGLLEELPGAPHRSEHEWAAADARTVALLDQPLPSWPHLIMANVLLDRALALILETALDSRYLPLRQRARKIIEEEHYHAIHGQGWLPQLSAEGPAMRQRLGEIVSQAWEDVLCWFGPDDGGALAPLVELGVLREAGEPVRARFLGLIGPLLQDSGVPVPVRREGSRWTLTDPLPWRTWDEHARRVRR
jgi:ring-1,2-phenylacetyl-CoA epoxidase subunit PaaA/ring-1,2-phenylacetyl-CoA epoxidase subunit PaaC